MSEVPLWQNLSKGQHGVTVYRYNNTVARLEAESELPASYFASARYSIVTILTDSGLFDIFIKSSREDFEILSPRHRWDFRGINLITRVEFENDEFST